MSNEIEILEPEHYTSDSDENALNKSLEAPKLDPVVLAIANDNLAGLTVDAIAERYNVSTETVATVLDKKEVQNYVNTVILNQGYFNRAKRLQLINRVIMEKVEEAITTGFYSKKDLFDWLKLVNETENAIKPKDVNKPGVAIQINNYDKLMNDLLGE